MTAIVGILNKRAVTIAADSALCRLDLPISYMNNSS